MKTWRAAGPGRLAAMVALGRLACAEADLLADHAACDSVCEVARIEPGDGVAFLDPGPQQLIDEPSGTLEHHLGGATAV